MALQPLQYESNPINYGSHITIIIIAQSGKNPLAQPSSLIMDVIDLLTHQKQPTVACIAVNKN